MAVSLPATGLLVRAPWFISPHLDQDELMDLAGVSVTRGHPLFEYECHVMAARVAPDQLLVEAVGAPWPGLYALFRFRRRHYIDGWHFPRIRLFRSRASVQMMLDEAVRLNGSAPTGGRVGIVPVRLTQRP